MAKKKKGTEIKEFENVQNALNKSEVFIEKNQKILFIILGVIILVIMGIFGYKNYYLEPKEKEAQDGIYKAEQYFAQDSFQLALNGDGENLGFLDIIAKYGMTKTADLAKVYTGVCYKSLGEYEKALSYLKNFEKDDQSLTPAVQGAIGDCYLAMGEKEKAISFFQKAAASNVDGIAPIYMEREGLTYISMNNYKEAAPLFEKIKKKYPNSMQGQEADKYLQLINEQN